MALKKKSKVTSLFTKKDAEKMAEEYSEISKQIKMLQDKKTDLATKLKQMAESLGVVDDKGSSYIDGEDFIIGKVAKKSVSIDQSKGVDLLEKKGLLKCVNVKTVKTVDEKAVEQAVADEELTEEDVQEFTKVSVSYSVSVKEKSEMPEVEVTTAAKKRK